MIFLSYCKLTLLFIMDEVKSKVLLYICTLVLLSMSNVVFKWTYRFPSSQEKNLIQTHHILKSICTFTVFYSSRQFLVPNFLYTNQEDEGTQVRDKKIPVLIFITYRCNDPPCSLPSNTYF